MSLRTRLLLSYAVVILLALVLAGAASVAFRWRERQQATLDRLAVTAPQLTFDLFRLRRQGATQEQIAAFLREEARQRGVRVLVVDRAGTVQFDTGDSLRGRRLEPPADTEVARPFGYRTWSGREGEQAGLVFLEARALNRGGPGVPRLIPPLELAESVVLAVPRQTLARAWLGLVPGLAWAGLIALLLSTIVAAALARSITRPLHALTRASEAIARGHYDQEIVARRSDEVGRLAGAFNDMARQVGRSHIQMRTLIANVSHDLKTPLTSILGFSQALRDGAVAGPEQAVETGAIIHEEAERVQALVDDLLYLSEIEAGQVVLARDAVDLGALALRSARRFEPALRARNVTLLLEAPIEERGVPPLRVLGDSAKLERVLDNLLDNARKYTPDGGRVLVRGHIEPATPALVRVDVFNSGSSIPPEDLPRVFERFYRMDRARTRAGGSGLGLAIARELAELHGGTLTAGSDSMGVTFTLRLPRATGGARPTARAATATADTGRATTRAASA